MEQSPPAVPSIGEAEDRLAWIFGSSRSGSTWLLRMLSALDGVAAIDDPHLGHHLGVWRPISLAWATAEHPPDLTTLDRVKHDKDSYFFSDRYRDAWAPALRALIVDRFDAQARDLAGGAGASPEPLVVVKEPGSHVADLLVSLFPGSRLVFLLRDGRDVVDSWLAAYRPGSWALDEGAFPVTDPGRESLVRWQSAVWAFRTEVVQQVFAGHPADRRVLVRYEDLVADPARELARICTYLAIDATADRLADVAAEHAYDAVPRAAKGDTKEIRSATPGGWRDNLTPAEHDVMHEVMGRQLAALGYLEPEAAGLA
ncbi:MAG TPA: sulfotransferase [Acidimicrobiales bacterium]|nr:sulfotransferase [Acidimicrobiales bacterium]